MATVKELETRLNGLRKCVISGHHWSTQIEGSDFSSRCTMLNFECKQCEAGKIVFLHGKEHEALQILINNALNK